MMEEMNAAIEAVSSPAVKIWMNWMMVIFLASLLFVWKQVSARYIIGAFILSLPVAMMVWHFTGNPHLLGIAHIVVWGPLAAWLIKTEFLDKKIRPASFYGVYLILLLLTIAISLVFDIREVFLATFDLR
ncbi:MAG: hypothetical protein MI673_09015 [Thiotrichales bacterium]|nr:hypothetical protein [Thiotrichales bacterium]